MNNKQNSNNESRSVRDDLRFTDKIYKDNPELIKIHKEFIEQMDLVLAWNQNY